VVHEENELSRGGFIDQFARLIRAGRKWFFNEYVLAGR
jgi:hypothetical protein